MSRRKSSTLTTTLGKVVLSAVATTFLAVPAVADIVATGDVDPSDPNTWTDSTDGYIGRTASGSVTVDSGSELLSDYGYIAYRSGSTGTVTVSEAGSTWDNSGGLYVGHEGSGALSITDGGAVRNPRDGTIGHKPGSTGTVTVSGAGSSWNTGLLYVGYYGNGALSITVGATVSNSWGAIGRKSGSTGTVTVSGAGSTWNNSGSLTVGDSGSGVLSITDGGVVSNSWGSIGYGSTLKSTVTVSGAGSTWNIDTYLDIGGGGAGELSIADGGLVSVGKKLTIDSGRYGDSFIDMSTGGMLVLLGVPNESLDHFLNRIDGTDPIRYWDDVADDWSNVTNATPGVDYTLAYFDSGDLAGHTMLTIGTYLRPGDANLDGETDLTDFNIWNANKFTSGTGWTTADFNGDGTTDLSDFNIWNANKFTVATGGAAPAPSEVPEPGTLGLLILAMAIGLACRHWRR